MMVMVQLWWVNRSGSSRGTNLLIIANYCILVAGQYITVHCHEAYCIAVHFCSSKRYSCIAAFLQHFSQHIGINYSRAICFLQQGIAYYGIASSACSLKGRARQCIALQIYRLHLRKPKTLSASALVAYFLHLRTHSSVDPL